MIEQSGESELRISRIHAQMLGEPSETATVPEVVRRVCGIQAQDASAAALGIRVRSRNTSVSEVDIALLEERSLVRTWAMRGTLHVLPAEDLSWMIGLLGPVLIARGLRRRAELGLSDDLCERGVEVIRNAISRIGPLSREALKTHLDEASIPTKGQAVYHLLLYTALKGRICVVPGDGARPAYALVEEWLPGAMRRHPADPPAELARRYLAGYGPATPADFAAWSGLPRRTANDAWKVLAGKLKEVRTSDGTVWMLKSAEAAGTTGAEPPRVRLLPAYDNLLLGYRSREWILAPDHAARIRPGGGVIRPSVLVDGRVAGRWSIERRRGRTLVTVESFERLSPPVLERVANEVDDVGRFLGEEVLLADVT